MRRIWSMLLSALFTKQRQSVLGKALISVVLFLRSGKKESPWWHGAFRDWAHSWTHQICLDSQGEVMMKDGTGHQLSKRNTQSLPQSYHTDRTRDEEGEGPLHSRCSRGWLAIPLVRERIQFHANAGYPKNPACIAQQGLNKSVYFLFNCTVCFLIIININV